MSDEYDVCGWDWPCIGEKIVNLTKYNDEYYDTINVMYTCGDPDHPENRCWHEDPLKIALKSVALFIIMLFGIPGNLSIIAIILKNKLLRKQPNNLFLLNMAVTDLLNLTVNTTLYFFRPDNIFRNYYLGPFLCKLSPLLVSKLEYFFNQNETFYVLLLVYMFVCGALSLTSLTISRVLGIVFPKVADYLTFNRWVIFLIIIFIHISSLLCTWPSIDYDGWRRSWVNHYANIDYVVCTDSE